MSVWVWNSWKVHVFFSKKKQSFFVATIIPIQLLSKKVFWTYSREKKMFFFFWKKKKVFCTYETLFFLNSSVFSKKTKKCFFQKNVTANIFTKTYWKLGDELAILRERVKAWRLVYRHHKHNKLLKQFVQNLIRTGLPLKVYIKQV